VLAGVSFEDDVMDVLLVGPWGPAALAFARSLHSEGIGVYLLQATAQHPDSSSLSVLRGTTSLPPHLVGTAEGLDRIQAYARAINATALVAMVDRELVWLAEHRDRFEPSCRVLSQSSRSLFPLLSKRFQLLLAGKAGLSVLPTHVLMRPEDVESIAAHDYPLVLRPDRHDDIEPSFKARLVESRTQLERLIRDCTHIDSPLIAQPFRRFPNLVVHGVRAVDGQVIASRCFRVPRKFEAVSLTLEPTVFPDALEQQCVEFARLAGITGCYHLEFLFSDEDARAYFLEVNVRLGGTTDKVVRAGFDEPLLLLQAYGIRPPSPSVTGSTARRVANKRVLLKHIVRAARGQLTTLDYPNVNRMTHIAYSCRDLIVATDSTFDWRDIVGSIRFHLRNIGSE
jgi:predicted ATP-grasp superfamily ATP-dependent carboligase